MKPKLIPYYETTDGRAVKTLREWKEAEIFYCLKDWKDEFAEDIDQDVLNKLVAVVIDQSFEFTEILGIKEKGRPTGAKDRKPRKRVKAENTEPATPPLTFEDFENASEPTQTNE